MFPESCVEDAHLRDGFAPLPELFLLVVGGGHEEGVQFHALPVRQHQLHASGAARLPPQLLRQTKAKAPQPTIQM
eukprot:9064067-Pyramimonas_sp.AAC.1